MLLLKKWVVIVLEWWHNGSTSAGRRISDDDQSYTSGGLKKASGSCSGAGNNMHAIRSTVAVNKVRNFCRGGKWGFVRLFEVLDWNSQTGISAASTQYSSSSPRSPKKSPKRRFIDWKTEIRCLVFSPVLYWHLNPTLYQEWFLSHLQQGQFIRTYAPQESRARNILRGITSCELNICAIRQEETNHSLIA